MKTIYFILFTICFTFLRAQEFNTIPTANGMAVEIKGERIDPTVITDPKGDVSLLLQASDDDDDAVIKFNGNRNISSIGLDNNFWEIGLKGSDELGIYHTDGPASSPQNGAIMTFQNSSAIPRVKMGTGNYGIASFSIENLNHGNQGIHVISHGSAIYGESTNAVTPVGQAAIHGKSEHTQGIFGESTNHYGIEGKGPTGIYGRGNGNNAVGVYGLAGSGTNSKGIQGNVSGENGFSGYFTGGVGVYISNQLGISRTNPQFPIHVGSSGGSADGNGAHVTTGGVWTNGSSREFKEHFTKVDKLEILNRLVELDIQKWQYKNSSEGTRLGPVAEDFHKAFKLGNDEQYISTIDANGVALVSIQALWEIIKNQQKDIEKLTKDLKRIQEQ